MERWSGLGSRDGLGRPDGGDVPSTARCWPVFDAGPSRPRAYDVAVVGRTTLALAIAWQLASEGAAVVLVCPGCVGADWPMYRRAFLRRLGVAPAVAALVAPSADLYRRWAVAGSIDGGGPAVSEVITIGPHVALACSADEAYDLRRGAERTEGIAEITADDVVDAVPGVSRAALVAAWRESSAGVVAVDGLLRGLAASAAGAGVDIAENAFMTDLARSGDGWISQVRLEGPTRTGAGASTVALGAKVVVDAGSELSLVAGRGSRPLAAGIVERWFVTEPIAPIDPLTAGSVAIGSVVMCQNPTGEVVGAVRASPIDRHWGTRGFGALGPAARAVVEAVPAWSGFRVVQTGTVTGAWGLDGVPLVGPVDDGLWAAGGFGFDEVAVAPAVSRALASSVVGGGSVPSLEPFDPYAPRQPAQAPQLTEPTFAGQAS